MNEYTLIDADALIGRHPQRSVGDGSATELLSVMDRVGIAEALVGHTMSWLHDPAVGNRILIESIASCPRLRPCWVMLPDTCGEMGAASAFIREASRAGVVAVRAYPADHGYDLAGADAAPVLDALAEAGMPLFVDAGQTDWGSIEAVAQARPTLPVVVCRPGYRVLRRLAGTLGRVDNVYVDLANFSSHCGVEWLVHRVGPGRLLFGTGAPEHDPADVVARLLWSELDDDAVIAIGSGNLRTLLREQEADT